MSPSRYPILIFTLVGVLLVFAQDTLSRGLMNLALGPHRRVAGILANVLNWIGPGIWLLAIALCLLLTIGSATPPWTRGRWPSAIVVFYLFHLPLLAFPPLAIFGRWGYTVYFFLGAVGVVCAIRQLLGSFHLAAVFLLAEPVARSVLWGRLHGSARILAMTFFAVVGFPLLGWWLRDTAASHSRYRGPQKLAVALPPGVVWQARRRLWAAERWIALLMLPLQGRAVNVPPSGGVGPGNYLAPLQSAYDLRRPEVAPCGASPYMMGPLPTAYESV